MIRHGIPRGAYPKEFAIQIVDVIRAVAAMFPYLCIERFPGLWPLRDMIIAKLQEQRKYDKGKAGGSDSNNGSASDDEGEIEGDAAMDVTGEEDDGELDKLDEDIMFTSLGPLLSVYLGCASQISFIPPL
jgi:hypothetical protein